MVDERLVAAAMPIVRTMKPREDIRRAQRVDRGLDAKGNPIVSMAFDAAWDGNTPLRLGTYHLWVDGSGRLRVKNGKATSDTDGTVVGVQT